jgi:amidase
MARYTEDLVLAMGLLIGEDGEDFTSPPVPLFECGDTSQLRVAFFSENGFSRCTDPVKNAVLQCADFLAEIGMRVEESKPPGIEEAFDLEFALLGVDGVDGIDDYLREAGSTQVHPLLTAWLDRMRPLRATASELAARWAQWDKYRTGITRFFDRCDVIVSPVYTQPALKHGDSIEDGNFDGFSYTIAWNLAGTPAATVRCAEANGLPIDVQIVAKPWRDLTALAVAKLIEREFGGWKPPESYLAGTKRNDTGDGTL